MTSMLMTLTAAAAVLLILGLAWRRRRAGSHRASLRNAAVCDGLPIGFVIGDGDHQGDGGDDGAQDGEDGNGDSAASEAGAVDTADQFAAGADAPAGWSE